MNSIELKIANLVCLNMQHVNKIGLSDGMMGIIIYLYTFSAKHKLNYYENIADLYLDKIIDTIEKNYYYSFYDLIGFSWGIRYLVSEGLIAGNPNEILIDIDKKIVNKLTFRQEVDIAQIIYSNEPVIPYLKEIHAQYTMEINAFYDLIKQKGVSNKTINNIVDLGFTDIISNKLLISSNHKFTIRDKLMNNYISFIYTKRLNETISSYDTLITKVIINPTISNLSLSKGLSGLGLSFIDRRKSIEKI